MSDQLTPSDSTADQAVVSADAAAPSLTNPSRRYLLRAAGVGGAVIAVGAAAAACGSSSNGSTTDPAQASSAAGDPASSSPAAATGGSSAAAAGGSGTPLYSTSQIPLKGGMINASADGGIVVTQPSSGEYKAFTSTCTHMGCTVGTVSNNVIQCPCHGSQFSAVDGSVVNGPATKPLAAKNITVSGGNIFAS
jgi:Rieske Fe-S protein